jgi:sialic acid synthase SpsE
MSTGSLTEPGKMATDDQIWKALEWLDGLDITLLHCVSEYPAANPHYERIRELRHFGHKVGISDHTQKLVFPPMDVIEKHFKLDDDCIDAKVSITPEQLYRLIENLRNFEKTIYAEK